MLLLPQRLGQAVARLPAAPWDRCAEDTLTVRGPAAVSITLISDARGKARGVELRPRAGPWAPGFLRCIRRGLLGLRLTRDDDAGPAGAQVRATLIGL